MPNERRKTIGKVLKAGALYFLFAFGAGFALGTIRVLWMVPAFGERIAELCEMPVMLAIIILSARWIIRRLAVPFAVKIRLGVGFIALGLLLTVEFTVVLWLRGLTLHDYFSSRDPVSGTVYFVMLGVFAVLPLLVGRK